MKYHAVLFDADGTLFDFHRAESYALEEAFRELGLAFRPEYRESYEEINREVWRQFERGEISSVELRLLRFERFLAEIGAAVDAEQMSASYLVWLARAEFLLDGAQELVESLAGKVKLAIVTNGLKDVQRGRFGRSPIRSHFDSIVISEEIGVQKPDPAIFVHALASLDHEDKRSVLMVGDSLTSDIQGGVNFGIDTCWFNPAGSRLPESPTPSYVIERLEEVVPLCLGNGDEQSR